MYDLKELFSINPSDVISRVFNSFLPGWHSVVLLKPDLYGPMIAVFMLPQVLIERFNIPLHIADLDILVVVITQYGHVATWLQSIVRLRERCRCQHMSLARLVIPLSTFCICYCTDDKNQALFKHDGVRLQQFDSLTSTYPVSMAADIVFMLGMLL